MKKNRITTILISTFFICAVLFCIFKSDEVFSVAERRPLKTFPTVTLSKVQSGRFMEEFEDYVLDQFPLRDGFRGLKAWFEKNIFQKKNNNDIYVEDGFAVEMVYPMDDVSVNNASKVIKAIYDAYLADSGSKVYFSMIPDKNYFLAEQSGQLSMDYKVFMDTMKEKMSHMEYIDIVDSLSIEDYYRTDSHWKQDAIVETAKILNEHMGSSITGKYEKKEIDRPFRGVYSGQWVLPLEEDSVVCLTNPIIDQYIVHDHENDCSIPVYDLEKAYGHDMYETYLGGSLSLITIENPEINSKKELILFRDSFGSSIAPLLAEGYSKVTLVDIRYIRWERLEQFIDFEDKDVLFLYSTALLNHNEIR